MSTRLAVLDRPTLERMLELRGDTEAIEASAIAGELEIARDRVFGRFSEKPRSSSNRCRSTVDAGSVLSKGYGQRRIKSRWH